MYPPSEKLRVDGYVERGDQTVGFVCQADNRQQLRILGLRHALVARRGAVRSYTVPAAVRGAYRDVQQLLGQPIERPGTHALLDVAPDALEGPRVVREDLPEIVDPVGLAGRHDGVVDLPHFRCCFVVFDRLSPGAHTPPELPRDLLKRDQWTPSCKPGVYHMRHILKWAPQTHPQHLEPRFRGDVKVTWLFRNI